MKTRWLLRSVLGGLAACGWGVVQAADSYTCKQLDVPGATWTQVWRLNDAGQVAAASSLGAFLYDGKRGGWKPLPEPPAGSGYSVADLGAFDINNLGSVVGVAVDPANPSNGRGFILGSVAGPTSYQFVDYADPSAPQNTYVELRGLNDAGLVLGWAYDPLPGPLGELYTGQAFVFNPTGSVQGIFNPGFNPVTPKLSDGLPASYAIPGGINNRGQFALSGASATIAKEGLLYDPGTLTYYSLSLPGKVVTALRGVNDRDRNARGNCTGQQCIRTVGWSRAKGSSTYESFFADFDSVTGWQPVTFIDCASSLPSSVNGVLLQGVNNRNIVTGSFSDASGTSHGVIAYPNRVLPSQIVRGSFVFNVTVAASVSVFLDPSLAAGYRYATARGNPNFASVTLPIGIGDDQYTLLVNGIAFAVAGGDTFDFTAHGWSGGVSGFSVLGIEASAGLGAADPEAFVTEVTFVAGGLFTGSMTPLTAATELSALTSTLDGGHYPGRLEDDAERAQRAYQAGNVATACSALVALESDALRLLAGTPDRAQLIEMQAAAAANAVDCP